MPEPAQVLTRADAERIVIDRELGGTAHPDSEACGRNGIGIELEFLTSHGGDRLGLERARSIRDVLADQLDASRLTIEPGGQLELSCRPYGSIDEACDAIAMDLYRLDRSCARDGIGLHALGQDPEREPRRIVVAPRYRAMQAYFDSLGSDGITMMANTASIQINLGLGGTPAEVARRWKVLNATGPALTACFANSPFAGGGPSGWQSSRLRTWWQLDPSRSAPVGGEAGADPAEEWLGYALAAKVMLIRSGPDRFEPITEPMSFAEWIDQGHRLGYPTAADFEYHLTTLFPPVRPRAWFEVRYIDALPTPFWHVATAVLAALTQHPDLDTDITAAVGDTGTSWIDASQLGLGHPQLAVAGRALFDLAVAALPELGAGESTIELVEGYIERWVGQARSPADDALDRWRRDGTLWAVRESPVPYGASLAYDAIQC